MDFILPQAAKTQERALTVSEVTEFVRGAIEGEPKLQGVWVRGETSNVRPASTGHLYFTLKDEDSELACVFFGYSRQRKKPLEDGTAVLAFGNISVYARRGSYQLVVSDIIPQGEGELAARFEQLKRQLAEEGLFAPEHKALPPEMPRTVGVVTSPQAAAFTDVVNVLTRRAPYLHVVLFPTAVQGDAAAEQIIQALKQADASGVCEAILLVRGGGSLEDLWCFNDEALARQLYKMKTPVITGVGHEVDFTIADFAADVRAPTPSVAAEMAAPDVRDLRAGLASRGGMLARSALGRIRRTETAFRAVQAGRLVRRVRGELADTEAGLHAAAKAMLRSLRAWTGRQEERTAHLSQRLAPRKAQRQMEDRMSDLDRTAADLVAASMRKMDEHARGLTLAGAKLGAVDPREALRRGYALLWDEEMEHLITRAAALTPGQAFTAELHDGLVRGEVKETAPKEER
jgi:exodeoxyribonuclease VII large subunit